jgi:DNA replication protein DnaC
MRPNKRVWQECSIMFTKNEIQTRLKDVGLPRLIPAYLQTTSDKNIDIEKLNDAMGQLLSYYLQDRIERLYENNIRRSCLPHTGLSIDDINWENYGNVEWYKLERIREGEWIQQSRTVLLHGDSDKDQLKLGCIIASELMLQGHSVRCYSLKELTHDLVKAHSKETMKKTLAALKRLDVLFLYDFEPTQLSAFECYSLANVIDARTVQGAILISSSTVPDDWCKSLDDVGLMHRIKSVIQTELIEFNFSRRRNKEACHD